MEGAAMSKRRLGRGLNSLIGGGSAEGEAAEPGLTQLGSQDHAHIAPTVHEPMPEFLEVSVREIEPNPYQPRKEFDPGALDDLMDSIIQHGILQPLLVRKVEVGFQLIAGERRLMAARKAGLNTVPCKITHLDDRAMFEVAIMENLQREDLSELEKAQAFNDYLERFICTVEDLAKKLGKDRSTISNSLRLLELPEFVKVAMRTRKITAGHARALLSLDEESDQIAMCQRIQSEGLSVRQTEEQVRLKSQETVLPFGESSHTAPGDQPEKPHVTNHLTSLMQQLRELVGVKVEIRMKSKDAGKLIIHFNSNDEFERVVDQLRHAS